MCFITPQLQSGDCQSCASWHPEVFSIDKQGFLSFMYGILPACRCPPSARDPEIEALGEEDNRDLHDAYLARPESQIEMQMVHLFCPEGAKQN